MTTVVLPLVVVEGGRDAWLRRLGIYGSNAELEEALTVLERRAALREVPKVANSAIDPEVEG